MEKSLRNIETYSCLELLGVSVVSVMYLLSLGLITENLGKIHKILATLTIDLEIQGFMYKKFP